MALPQLTIWRALQWREDCCKSLPIWILLTHNIQGCPWACEKLWQVPKNGRNFEKEWDATSEHPCGGSLWLMGYWFCRPLAFILLQWIHSGGCWLCFKMCGSYCHSQKWCQDSHEISQEEYIFPFWSSKRVDKWQRDSLLQCTIEEILGTLQC